MFGTVLLQLMGVCGHVTCVAGDFEVNSRGFVSCDFGTDLKAGKLSFNVEPIPSCNDTGNTVPPLTGLFITTTTHPAKDPVKPTGSKKDSDVDSAPSGQGGPDAEADVTQPALQLISKFVTQLAEDITSGLKQGEDTRDVDGGIVKRDGGNNDTSFLQTPIFSLIMIVAFVGVIVLMVVLLLRQRGVVLPTLRRNRNSVTVPENYEHPSSHHYDRHLPSAPQTQRVLNPTFNRDSVGAQDYSVIDEDLEMEAVPAASPGHDVDYSYCL